jgi:hypothetical protein
MEISIVDPKKYVNPKKYWIACPTLSSSIVHTILEENNYL